MFNLNLIDSLLRFDTLRVFSVLCDDFLHGQQAAIDNQPYVQTLNLYIK
jgi:hypothetical protein